MQVPHRFLHTIGLLDCCHYRGCWRNKVVKINNDRSICHRPIEKAAQTVPLCMDLISAENVVEAVMSYYTDKTLPPISPSEMRLEPIVRNDVFHDLGGLAQPTPTLQIIDKLYKSPNTKKAATSPDGATDTLRKSGSSSTVR